MSLKNRLGRSFSSFTPREGFLLLIGWVMGALLNLYPKPILVVSSIAVLLFLLRVVIEAARSEKPNPISAWEQSLRQPTGAALQEIERANLHCLVVGSTIEITPHPNLSTKATIEELGWDPMDVRVRDLQQSFASENLLERIGGVKQYDPPNRVKFSLSNTSFVTVDSPNLELQLTGTDYFTLRSVKSALEVNPKLRSEFGNLRPSLNHIPHSVCLHYIVRFNNGDVLAMKRDPDAKYFGGFWSMSGEEQIAECDLTGDYPLYDLFRRAFCEEVLALRDTNPKTLDQRWAIASKIVRCMRLWSVVLEEELFNFSLVGVYQLNIDRQEFAEFHKALVNRALGMRDNEGGIFVIERDMILPILMDQQGKAIALFDQSATREEPIRTADLHPTSRYRLFRLARAISREPLDQVLSYDELFKSAAAG